MEDSLLMKTSKIYNYLLTIREIREEAKDIRTFYIDTEGKEFYYSAGQFVIIYLPEYPNIRRAYSISSSPTETEKTGQIALTIKLVPDGQFTPKIFQANVGDKINLMGPFGDFVYIPGSAENVVLIGAGIGIAPLRSIIKYLVDINAKEKIYLFYSARTMENLVFYNFFKKLEEEGSINFFATLTRCEDTTKWNGRTGRFDVDFLKEKLENLEKDSTKFFICGTRDFGESMKKIIVENLGVDIKNIKVEAF